jgi:hypothetical protein
LREQGDEGEYLDLRESVQKEGWNWTLLGSKRQGDVRIGLGSIWETLLSILET